MGGVFMEPNVEPHGTYELWTTSTDCEVSPNAKKTHPPMIQDEINFNYCRDCCGRPLTDREMNSAAYYGFVDLDGRPPNVSDAEPLCYYQKSDSGQCKHKEPKENDGKFDLRGCKYVCRPRLPESATKEPVQQPIQQMKQPAQQPPKPFCRPGREKWRHISGKWSFLSGK